MLFFKGARCLVKIPFNGGPPRNDRRKNVVYKIPCAICSFCYVGKTSQWFDERESQHKRSMRNCDSNNGIYMHIAKHPDHTIAWENTTFLDYDQNFYARRMKEYILIFSQRQEPWIWKMACLKTTSGMPLCRYSEKKFWKKTEPNCQNIAVHLHFLFLLEMFIPTEHISIPSLRNPRAWYLLRKTSL